ncbi:hypothetical protein QJS10_CPA01g02882 [Acorus calamus]|uniref:Uncharacterized protein n=1 Tax=Acorus calamus TaxID=4465 RepID=A0AAV9FFA4_ACOCL|nr:hypothetical protein QJS10_CPA01g02882 [Acorus calamus]
MTRVYAETSLRGITSKNVRARSACLACMSPEVIALYEESSLEGLAVKAQRRGGRQRSQAFSSYGSDPLNMV